MKRSIRKAVAALALAMLGTQATSAATYNEIGDAVALLPGQAVGGGITQIAGAIAEVGDVDLYALWLPAGQFAAATVGQTLVDTQLYLFNSAGLGLAGNDDAANDGLQSSLSMLLSGGLYYLAISAFNQDPVSLSGAIFPDTTDYTGDPQWGPTGVGGGDPLTGWVATTGSVTTQTGAYTITLSDATVPVPTTAALLGIGLAALFATGRRRT